MGTQTIASSISVAKQGTINLRFLTLTSGVPSTVTQPTTSTVYLAVGSTNASADSIVATGPDSTGIYTVTIVLGFSAFDTAGNTNVFSGKVELILRVALNTASNPTTFLVTQSYLNLRLASIPNNPASTLPQWYGDAGSITAYVPLTVNLNNPGMNDLTKITTSLFTFNSYTATYSSYYQSQANPILSTLTLNVPSTSLSTTCPTSTTTLPNTLTFTAIPGSYVVSYTPSSTASSGWQGTSVVPFYAVGSNDYIIYLKITNDLSVNQSNYPSFPPLTFDPPRLDSTRTYSANPKVVISVVAPGTPIIHLGTCNTGGTASLNWNGTWTSGIYMFNVNYFNTNIGQYGGTVVAGKGGNSGTALYP